MDHCLITTNRGVVKNRVGRQEHVGRERIYKIQWLIWLDCTWDLMKLSLIVSSDIYILVFFSHFINRPIQLFLHYSDHNILISNYYAALQFHSLLNHSKHNWFHISSLKLVPEWMFIIERENIKIPGWVATGFGAPYRKFCQNWKQNLRSDRIICRKLPEYMTSRKTEL